MMYVTISGLKLLVSIARIEATDSRCPFVPLQARQGQPAWRRRSSNLKVGDSRTDRQKATQKVGSWPQFNLILVATG